MSILFFSFCSDFWAIFALLTIFGNMHRPCKQHPNIVNNSLCETVFAIFSHRHPRGGEMSGRLWPALSSSVVEQLQGAQLAGVVVVVVASLRLG